MGFGANAVSASKSFLTARVDSPRRQSRDVDLGYVCCFNKLASTILSVREPFDMGKPPPEFSKQDFDNLSSRVQAEEKNSRMLESSLGEVKNSIATIQKDLNAKPTTRHLLMTLGLVAAILGSLLMAYFNSRRETDKNVTDALDKLRDQATLHAGQLSKTNERLASLESKFELLLSTLLKNITKDIDPSKPTPTKAKLETLSAFLVEAKNQDYVIDPKAVEQGGKSLLNYADLFESQQLAPSAWEAMTQFAVYRSFLNQKIDPVADQEYSRVPIEIQPGSHVIDSSFEDADVTLDGAILENVMFKDSTIRYNGGPLNLKDVRFQNCTFQFARTSRSLRLVSDMLAQNPLSVNFL